MTDRHRDETQHIVKPDTQHLEITGPAMTQHDPAEQPQAPAGHTPFRVEPTTPVPDDVVRPDGETDVEARPVLPQPSTSPAPAWSPPRQGLVTVRRGPLPVTIMVGLLSLIVAGYVLVSNLAGADLDLRMMGPMAFGSFGGLLLLVGLIGLVAGGRGRARD